MKRKPLLLTVFFIFLMSIVGNTGDHEILAIGECSIVLTPPSNDLCEGATDLGVIECNYFEQYFADPEETTGWDGTLNGSKLPPGVFVYTVQYFEDEVEKTALGTITLVR